MSLGAETDLSEDLSRSIAAKVREELARRRMSRQRLADEARISISTLEKALSGRRPFTLATTIRLEQALGTPLRSETARNGPRGAPHGFAPEALGSYSRPAAKWLEGEYLTLRPSFGEKGAVYAYRTEIAWDEAGSALVFRESARLDAAFNQKGQVSISNLSGHVYLVTSEIGQYRLIILSRPTISGEMYGILSTLQAGIGSQLMPAAAPIAFVPLANAPDAEFGKISRGHAMHARYRDHLERIVEESYARFFLP
jgi:transcriptional regulator with XRE-family HTH domain